MKYEITRRFMVAIKFIHLYLYIYMLIVFDVHFIYCNFLCRVKRSTYDM